MKTLLAIAFLALPSLALAQGGPASLTISGFGGDSINNEQVFVGIKLAFILAGVTFIPSILMTVTSFTRIAIVLSLTRQALGITQTPPNQVIVGLSIFLTMSIMAPVFEKVYEDALVPYADDQITTGEFFEEAFKPLRSFMLQHTREQDIALFLEIQGQEEQPEDESELHASVVIPAFIISELNTAFQITFLIFLPFLILDMVISSILTSMSMITLPPTVISLPIKLMLFVVIDGWHLIIGNVVKSYG